MKITISVHGVTVGLCWLIGLGFAIVDILVPPDWAALSTLFVVLGATLTVKRRIDIYAANWTQAYEVGRDQDAAGVRRIR